MPNATKTVDPHGSVFRGAMGRSQREAREGALVLPESPGA